MDNRRGKSRWCDDNKDEILRRYYDGENINNLCKDVGIGRQLFYQKLTEWNVSRRKKVMPKTRYNALYNVDYEYFDNIDCEHKAYWLGFLVADGHVNDRSVMIGLQNKDIKTIEDFKKDIKAEHPIRYDVNNNLVINIVCKRLCESLAKYGFHNHKSLYFDIDRALLAVPKEYEHHFIRGMFDGDGSVKYYKYDYQKVPFYHLGYTGVKNVCDYIMSKLNIETIIDEGNNLTYTVRTHNPKKIIEIYRYLYKDATIFMERKYNTFQEIIKIETERDCEYIKTNTNIKRDRCRYMTYNDETHSLKDWAKIRNIKYHTLLRRINQLHWSIGRALEYE